MIYIVHKGLSTPDKQSFLNVLGHAEISSDECQFIDLLHEDIDISTKDFIIAFNTYKDVARALISKGLFKTGDLLGSDMYDPSTKFCLINISHSITDIFSKDESKNIVWQKLLSFHTFYEECGKVGGLEGNNLSGQDSHSTVSDDTPFDDDISIIGEATAPIVDDVAEELVATIDIDLLVNKIGEQLDLSDPTLGKSLAVSSKFVFQSENATVSIYPNNRIPAKEQGINMSFKDSLALIKLAIMFDAKTVSFYKEKP